MKPSKMVILLSAITFTALYYEQSAGVNFILFTFVLSIISVIKKPQLVRSAAWLTCFSGALLSSLGVLLYGNLLSVSACIVSLLLLSALNTQPATSLVVAMAHTVYSYMLVVPSIIINMLVKQQNEDEESVKTRKLLLLIFPLAVCMIFFLLYRSANPLFKIATDKIEWPHLSLSLVMFFFYGCLLCYGFFTHRQMQQLADADNNALNQLSFVSDTDNQTSLVGKFIDFANEKFVASATFILLNILLLGVNATDIFYLLIVQELPAQLTLSEYLHDGTNALTFSIILSAALILLFFRGRLNFVNNVIVKWSVYIWILQNIFLVITTCNRNLFYISNFGLTHKRIGVFIFLALCVLGLLIILLKVANTKTLWYVGRANAWICFVTLNGLSVINWDAVIAKHNIELALRKSKMPDGYYLSELSYTALPVLQHYQSLQMQNKLPHKIFDAQLLDAIRRKEEMISNEINFTSWPSYCIVKNETMKNKLANDLLAQELH